MIVLQGGSGNAIHEQLQIGPHVNVGAQSDLVGWTLSLCEESCREFQKPSVPEAPVADGSWPRSCPISERYESPK